MGLLVDFGTSFFLGLLTPLTAVCVLPLYPAFLAFLANQRAKGGASISKGQYALLGAIITLGVILFMLFLGLIFTTFLQESLTNVVGIVSPIAFGILGLISLLLIFDIDFGKYLPKAKAPITKHPMLTALLYGFFFGAIVIPCNPGFISAFLARTVLISNFTSAMNNFLAFGLGLGFPLLLFSLISSNYSQAVISFLSRYKAWINRIAGIIMLIISVYYLVFVFNLFG